MSYADPVAVVEAPAERPSDAEYQAILGQLTQAENRLWQLRLVELYEDTPIPGFEPKTLWEELFGPKNAKSSQPWGVKLQRAIAAADVQVHIFNHLLADWDARNQAWIERPSPESEAEQQS